MFDKWLRLPAHLYLRITALTLLTVGIALSNVLMSIGAIWLIANWLIQADFHTYWQKFKTKKTVWWIVTIYFFLAVSIIWSDDIAYGFKDLRIKLPFIVIPLVLGTSAPLQKKHFYFLLYVFLGVVLYTSAYNYIHYNFILDNPNDIRSMSVFISHVRFAGLINFAIFICLYLIYKRKWNGMIWAVLLLWFLFYLYKSQIINGYILFVILSGFSVLFFIFKLKTKRLRIATLVTVGLGSLAAVLFLSREINRINTCDHIEYGELDKYTVNGNPYYHDTTSKQIENGHFVWLYVNKEEMSREWENRSSIAYDSTDHKGQPMFGTLIRYLTSRDYRKDSAGVAKLTNEEIIEIENGRTGVESNRGLLTRLDAFFMEYRIYKSGGDPNGNSLIQRIEHFKAAYGIIGNHWMFGVGAGDVPQMFKQEYAKMQSKLLEENQHRSHNQFLTIWVSLGIVGLILFLLLFVTAFREVKQVDYFMIMVLISLFVFCLFQDLIETQAGVTIFALFYSLALYRDVNEKEAL